MVVEEAEEDCFVVGRGRTIISWWGRWRRWWRVIRGLVGGFVHFCLRRKSRMVKMMMDLAIDLFLGDGEVKTVTL